MDAATLAKMEKHIAKQEILDCLTRYCRGMDRRDEAMMRSAFHEEAIDVHFSTACTIDGFVGWVWPYHASQRLHQHYISNHTCEIDGDVAYSEVYYQFVATYPDDSKRVTHAGGASCCARHQSAGGNVFRHQDEGGCFLRAAADREDCARWLRDYAAGQLKMRRAFPPSIASFSARDNSGSSFKE